MKKIIIIFIAFLLVCTSEGFAQKRNKRKKNQEKDNTEQSADNQDVTNIFIDATRYKLIGNSAKAKSLYEECLAKNSNHAASMNELAQIYYNNSDLQAAERYAEKAAEIEPSNKWYQFLLIEIYNKTGNRKKLLSTCTQLVEMDGNNLDFLYELANAYLMNNDAGNAIKTYNRIETLMGITEEISLQKQRIYLSKNKTDDAAAEINKLIQQFPEEKTRYLSMLAEMYMQAGKEETAAEYYQQILSTDPTNPYIHISLSDFYRKKGDIRKSFDELQAGFANPDLSIDTKISVLLTYFVSEEFYNQNKNEVLALAKTLVNTHPGEAKAHSMYADFLLNEKQYAEARDEYRRVIAIDSSKYAVWESLLNTNIQLADFNSLLNESSRATELFPLIPVPYLFKGLALNDKKQYTEAVESLNTGLKLVSGNNALLQQFYTYLGDNQHQLKNYKLSDENYEKALMINPDNSYVLNNYAYYLSLRNENLNKAETMSAKSVKLDPENPANMDTYGWVLYKLGRYAEALSWVEKAVAATPRSDGDLFEHLGDIHFKLGNTEKAVSFWQMAKDSGSTSEWLNKKISDKKLYE
jgi:tetratricopeptide (TPR) repeat protein